MGTMKTNRETHPLIDADRRRFFRALGASAIGGGTFVAALSAEAAQVGNEALPPAARKASLSEHQKKYFRTARM
ncbi:hypothetical protein [Hydrogenophilus thiooxidans]|uniref:hypothetical protein n=1 Tax=Hydrogenophilus thiooxidans TaxID=2820326 RepID=UPI001C234D49|nr:hypothetical protein [Hydrogenophilus thiooxidans]